MSPAYGRAVVAADAGVDRLLRAGQTLRLPRRGRVRIPAKRALLELENGQRVLL